MNDKPVTRQLTLRAYAKVNLFLDVRDKRPDGYHTIRTIFNRVNLYDTVTLTPADELSVVTEPTLDCSPRENLAWRAAEAFMRHSGFTQPAAIHIRKEIPAAAGLAGGSSNAAAVLWGLNRLHGAPLSRRELRRIGASLGSDVPFFLLGVPCATAGGRGEILRTTESRLDCPLLLANPGIGVSTAAGYRALDLSRGDQEYRYRRMRHALKRGDLLQVQRYHFNHFEDQLLKNEPAAARLHLRLREAGFYPYLSGSGPSYFVLHPRREQLDILADELTGSFPFIRITTFI